jgi:predicted dehydrogenase
VTDRVRIGVVGIGHLGKHHVRLLAQNPLAELAGLADVDAQALRAACGQYDVRGFADYRALADLSDAVCVVVPTHLHREVAGFFLENGCDVLVEKPITPSVAEGRELVELARTRARILQVGHVERFNPALKAIHDLGVQPRYLEAQRMAPFSFRSTDIGVVLDLMIHDIDLVLSLVGQRLRDVDAFGGAVFTPREDMASAVLKFEDGAVAHLTANRIALKPIRKLRMFSRDCYVSIDFSEAKGTVIRKQPGWDLQKLDLARFDRTQVEDLWKYVFEGLLSVQEYKLDEVNPLAEELGSFLQCVRERRRPLVSGEDGLAAVEVAARVIESIAANRW